MPTPRKRDGMDLPVSSDPPIEMTSLGEPNLPDPFLVAEGPPGSMVSLSGGLYPEVTASPYAGPMYPPPAYGEQESYISPAQPKAPCYIADTPEELNGMPPTSARPRQAPYRSDAAWHTEQSTTIVVNQQQPQVMSARPGPIEMVHSPDPVPTKCYNCDQQVVTYIYYESGACTWISCIAIALSGGTCGCCLIPFFVSTFKDNIHKCPKCHVIIGKHRKIC